MAVSKTFLAALCVAWLLALPAAAADCLLVNPLNQTTVPLTMTRADAVPSSVADGLVVRAGGAINTVRLEVRIHPGKNPREIATREQGLILEEVHVGPLLPASGFPVLWTDDARGESVRVGNGDALPLERIRSVVTDDDPMTRDPELLRVTLAVAGLRRRFHLLGRWRRSRATGLAGRGGGDRGPRHGLELGREHTACRRRPRPGVVRRLAGTWLAGDAL